jgi:hypothetical protein
MFIIDFDDTLFRTQDFKMARQEALQEVGVSKIQYETTYKLARTSSDGLFTYSDERHASELAKLGFEKEKMLCALQGTTERAGDFLDGQAVDFLKIIERRLEPKVLLSLGDPSFQELKVRGSGVSSFFDRLFMVETTKEKIIGELVRYHPEQIVWFINDKVTETSAVVKRFPVVQAVLKVSPSIPRTEYETSNLPYFDSLLDIAAYVTKES